MKSVLLVTVTRSESRNEQPSKRRRRDRHGRRPRGPLLPLSAPASSSRSEKFDSLVLDALEPIETRWRHRLADLDVAVDDVPDVRSASGAPDAGMLQDGLVPLSQLVPAGVDSRSGLPSRARIVLYRRPLEARTSGRTELAELVHRILVEQVAGYLGVEPDIIDGP